MCSNEPCVWDYDAVPEEDRGNFELDDCSEDNSERVPITPELLDRFVPLNKEYRLASGDVLEISVFGDEETTVENVTVAPDGRIYYTFLDGIVADGRTI